VAVAEAGGGGMSVTASLLPDPPRRRHLESDFQRGVNQFLRWSLPDNAMHFAIPNGLMRSKKAAARAVGEGVRAGISDMCIVWKGRAIFLELKTERGRLSEVQRQMIRKLEHCECPVIIARPIVEFEAHLREVAIPLRGSMVA